ncbi:MAG: acyl-CoA dehydrogenase family protein [Smithellaceae bacterium]
MKRKIYNEDHELFRQQYRKFLQSEVVPYYAQWEKDGIAPRSVWMKAAEMGYLCPWLPEEYGGSGIDFLYSAVMIEEVGSIANFGFDIHLHNDICVPYIWAHGTEEQKQKYLPGCVKGDYIMAIAISEADAGSDVKAIRTSAVKDGNDYILNGQKAFITNGIINNLAIVAAKTDTKIQPAYQGISLFLVEASNPGYKKGKQYEKMGWHSQDTAELIFEDCRVPKSALLGGVEGKGFKTMMTKLQQERLIIAIKALAEVWHILGMTKEYISTRKVFGQPIAEYQNTRFKMAEMFTTAEMCQVFVDRLIEDHVAGNKVDTETAMAKYFVTESLNKIVYDCLQFFGGYGYMEEYPICRSYRDARVTSIFGGANEIMKEIISKDILKRR